MSKPILVSNKKVCEKVRSFKDMLSKKTGKNVPISKAINLMFSDDNIIEKISGAEMKKKKRSKKEYVFQI